MTQDTLPQWLFHRFEAHTPYEQAEAKWLALTEDDVSYWEHEARAVRRAVARDGFKKPE